VVDHVSSARRFAYAQKEKPGGGNAGSDIFVIGVYGFKYAAWLSFMPPESGEAICFSFPAVSFSSSSLFLFFDYVSKFNRSLCDFASISVGLRTHSSLGGDAPIVARAMPAAFFVLESLR
jgi:hypothetical protein